MPFRPRRCIGKRLCELLLSPYKNKVRDKKAHEFGLSKEQYERINKIANYKYGFLYVLFGNKYAIDEKGGNEK